MPDGRVAVLASLNIDVTVLTPRIPAVGETIIGTEVSSSPGGKGGNQAVALARLGVDTTVIGCIGDDDNGRGYRAALHDEGLGSDHIRTVAGTATGAAFITVDAAGSNSIVVVPGANAAVSTIDVDHAEYAISLSTVMLAQLEVPLASITRAFAIAKLAGAITVLNPAPASLGLDAILANTDVFVPNEVEFVQITGVSPDSDAEILRGSAKLFASGVRWVIVTLGENGAALVGPEEVTRIPAFSVRATDTTAAGDSFVAGLVSVIAARGDLDRATMVSACEDGVQVAAWVVQRNGAQTSLPTRADVPLAVQSVSGRCPGIRSDALATASLILLC